MKSAEAVGVVQVGATGVEADLFRDYIAQDPRFKLEAVATASHPELRGQKLGKTSIDVPPSLEDVPVIGILDAIDNTDAPLIFSGLRARLAARYEGRLAAGRLVVTSTPAHPENLDAAMVSVFTNAGQIDQLYARDAEGRIIAGGSGITGIIAPALKPIHSVIGIESMSVKTMEGWSGAGYRELPDDPGHGNIPVEGDEQDKIMSELNHFLSDDIGAPEGILIGADPKWAPWLRGDYAELVLNLSRETSRQEIEELWRHFVAPDELKIIKSQLQAISLFGGDKWPKRHQPIKPVKLDHGPLVRFDATPYKLNRIQPMRVRAHIIDFDPEDPTRVIIAVSGDNLIQGDVGGNMLNAAYARAKGYL